jgi:hypothetical protein
VLVPRIYRAKGHDRLTGSDSTDKHYWAFNQDGWDGSGNSQNGGKFTLSGTNRNFYKLWSTTSSDVSRTSIMRSMQVEDGDFRRNMAMHEVPASRFKYTTYPGMAMESTDAMHSLTFLMQDSDQTSYMLATYPTDRRVYGQGLADVSYNQNSTNDQRPDLPADYDPTTGPTKTGDWDNGVAIDLDGPWANFPDGGNVYNPNDSGSYPPYFYEVDQDVPTNKVSFSPNRVMPSSGMLGSLPVGVKTGTSWRTLLFRPDEKNNHPGHKTPPDYLFMDLFWMPVVEPYAISDPFSTSGKINLNYQIIPFTYIKRKTGLYAVLKQERMLTIGNDKVTSYKTGDNQAALSERHSSFFRPRISVENTLKQFDIRFDSGAIFRTAATCFWCRRITAARSTPVRWIRFAPPCGVFGTDTG